jgi:hypothetical protein
MNAQGSASRRCTRRRPHRSRRSRRGSAPDVRLPSDSVIMKNQYFGDINDFRKYGLLRVLHRVTQLRVGVCWFLTEDDGGGDGELRSYLVKPERWRNYDPPLYDTLRRLNDASIRRSVTLAQKSALIPTASYFDALLTDDRAARAEYFGRAQQALGHCDVIFADPDNGIEVSSTKLGSSGSSRYVYWPELRAIYTAGQSILIYQHFPRVVRQRFIPLLAARLREELTGSTVTALATGYAVFFLVQQPKHADVLAGLAPQLRRQWRGQIEPWPAVADGWSSARAIRAGGNVSAAGQRRR